MDKHRCLSIFGLILWCSTALSWSPQPEPIDVDPDCHPQVASWNWMDENSQEKKFAKIQNYFTRCLSQLQNKKPQGDSADDDLTQLNYNLPTPTWLDWQDQSLDHRRIYRWQQSTKGKHPAVIVNCDLDCDLKKSIWIRRVVLHLFENGPFDVYVVNSFQRKWWVGGLRDGQVIYSIAKWLVTESEDRDRIGSLQVFSEGTNAPGGLFSLLYNERNPIADDRKALQGGVSLCPLVNPEPWLNNYSRENAVYHSVGEHLHFQKQNYDEWAYWLSHWQEGESISAPWWQATHDMSRKNQWLSPFRGMPPSTLEQIKIESDFARHANGMSIPIWVIGSNEDPRFNYEEQLGNLISQTKNPNKGRLRAFAIDDSSSCSWTSSLGWQAEGFVWRALLQSQSFEIWPRDFVREQPWSLPSPSLGSDEFFIDETWDLNERNEIMLRYWISSPTGSRAVDQLVSPTELPLELRPQNLINSADRASWSRQASQRLRLAKDRKPLLHTPDSPNLLLWRSWKSIDLN